MPRQRGNVRLSTLDVLNAVLYVAENGCKWRALPKEFGNWNTIYIRLNRWAKSEVLDRIFESLQRERLLRMKIEVTSLDSTIAESVKTWASVARRAGASKRDMDIMEAAYIRSKTV